MAKPLQFKAPKEYAPEYFDFPMGFSGGIDISKSADLIAQNKSPNMINMNYDGGGIPTKRYGFDLFLNLASAKSIQGIYEYEPAGGSKQKLIFLNGNLYKIEG